MTIILVFGIVTASVCADVEEYVCSFVRDGPVIDGKLEDDCWSAAEQAPTFYRLGVGGDRAPAQTRVRMVMDDDALYVGADAETRPGRMPQAPQRDRDGKVWHDPELEIFVSTSFVEPEYYHLAFNAAGSYADLRHGPGLSAEESREWDPSWEVVTDRRRGGWRAEARIPWAAFGNEKRPRRGWVWRIRLGAHADSYGNSMWPHNPDTSFHNPNCWAHIIFRDRNLVGNAGLERGIPEGNDAPAGWLFAYYDDEGKGKITVTDEEAASGEYAVRLEKFTDYKWFPVVYTRRLRVQPGSTYEIAASVKSLKRWRMRYNLLGEGGDKRGRFMPATDGWERVKMSANIPETGVNRLMVGFQFIKTAGVLFVDDIVIRRNNAVRGTAERVVVPHPYHELSELADRTAYKPYDLLQRKGGGFQSDRVIFRDTSTGARVWKLTRSAGTSTRHIYMEQTPWNADGTLLALHTGQLSKGTIIMPADGAKWRKLRFYASSYTWDRREPKRIWFRDYRGHDKTDLWDLAYGNVDTGEITIGKRFEGDINLWPMSEDGEKLLVQEKLISDDGEARSLLWLMERNGETGLKLDPGGWIHQSWFTKRGDYSVEFEYEGHKPPGQYVSTTDGEVRRISERTFGHRAHQPGGRWIATIGPCSIINMETGETRVISDKSSGHQTWRADADWYATSSRRYLRRVIAFGNTTTQLLGAHNSRLKHSTYWSEAHPEMSADGTKLAFASSMLGDIDFYWLVMRQPDAPRDLQIERRGERLQLSWRPGEKHAETHGYLVYRSSESGRRGEQLTPQPIERTEFSDSPDGPAYYRVTAIEHCGLESVPSKEVCPAEDWPGTARIYREAETGQFHKPAVEIFDAEAGGLYAVSLGKLKAADEGLNCRVQLPKADEWRLKVRAKSRKTGGITGSCAAGDFGAATVEKANWSWIAFADAVKLPAGETKISLKADGPNVAVDRILLVHDDGAKPGAGGTLDRDAPAGCEKLKAAAKGHYAVQLSWEANDESDLHHYNVYCGNKDDFSVKQPRLVASPEGARYIDWGLKQGKKYFYNVTAVDRAGNESRPSKIAAASTEPLKPQLFTRIDRKWNTTETEAIDLSFTMPAEGRFVLWGKVRSLNGKRGARVEMQLDGEKPGRHNISFSYICVGHGGPVLETWLWDCFRPRRDEVGGKMGWRASEGDHVLTLSATDNLKVAFHGFVITNDLGFEPTGTVDFLVEPGD